MQKIDKNSSLENIQVILSSSSIDPKYMKRKYSVPNIHEIKLDNEISLQLASDPPSYEGLNAGKIPECFIQNPFKDM